jgi:hypothetical protein
VLCVAPAKSGRSGDMIPAFVFSGSAFLSASSQDHKSTLENISNPHTDTTMDDPTIFRHTTRPTRIRAVASNFPQATFVTGAGCPSMISLPMRFGDFDRATRNITGHYDGRRPFILRKEMTKGDRDPRKEGSEITREPPHGKGGARPRPPGSLPHETGFEKSELGVEEEMHVSNAIRDDSSWWPVSGRLVGGNKLHGPASCSVWWRQTNPLPASQAPSSDVTN